MRTFFHFSREVNKIHNSNIKLIIFAKIVKIKTNSTLNESLNQNCTKLKLHLLLILTYPLLLSTIFQLFLINYLEFSEKTFFFHWILNFCLKTNYLFKFKFFLALLHSNNLYVVKSKYKKKLKTE